MTRLVLFTLLGIVAGAAAVLSFAALRDLGLSCGFDPRLAWLVPVVVDAGAAAGSVTWLASPPGMARVFGRRLALALLTASVAGNGVAHLLEAYRLQAPWWLVVIVSAMAPAILGATIHLAVVALQGGAETPLESAPEGAAHPNIRFPEPGNVVGGVAAPPSRPAEPIFGESRKSQVAQVAAVGGLNRSGDDPTPVRPDSTRLTVKSEDPDRVAGLIANGAGRRRIAKELGITEHQAREMLAGSRSEHQAGAR